MEFSLHPFWFCEEVETVFTLPVASPLLALASAPFQGLGRFLFQDQACWLSQASAAFRSAYCLPFGFNRFRLNSFVLGARPLDSQLTERKGWQ